MSVFREIRKNAQGSTIKGNVLDFFLLRMMGRLRPNGAVEVELRRFGLKDFASARAGHYQKSYGVRRFLILIGSQGGFQTP
jgi:hypothetical protein